MKSTLVFCAVLAAASAFGSVPREVPDALTGADRHVVIHAEHTLLPAERDALAKRGISIVSEAGSRRYVARITPGASTDDPAVARVEEIAVSSKIKPSAMRVANTLAPFVSGQIVFHRDITEARARQVIEAVGGRLESFDVTSTARVIVPRGRLLMLAGMDEVAQVHAVKRKLAPHNVVAAALSKVTPLHSAPYDLKGAGVKIGVGEVSNVYASHVEFGGRVIALSSGAPDTHATHVVGTVTGAGARAGTRGMAPEATVYVSVIDDGFLESKEAGYPAQDLLVDNNSWGYVVGWHYNSTRTEKWEWWGADEFGEYAFETAGLDNLSRRFGTVIVYSSGNDGGDSGPVSAPFPHYHEDATTVFCKSADGSGNDCPAVQCGSCEKVTHPGDGPFGTMSLLGAAKNVIAVGAVTSSKLIAGFSSRGPTADGRIKPDVVAKGTSQFSTFPNNSYGTLQGTSMSAPVVTGIAALVIEQWRRSFGGADPAPEIIRGLLIHGAEDLGNAGPDYTFGFGLVDAQAAVDVIRADGGSGSRLRTDAMTQGLSIDYSMTLPANSTGRVTLVWSDPENGPYPDHALINDLDVEVIDAAGGVTLPYVLNPGSPSTAAVRGVNVRDNVEQIVFPSVAGGVYRIRVKGSRIATAAPQPFTIFTSHTLAGAKVACADPFEPNNSVQDAYGRLPEGATLYAGLCDSGDSDFYRFVVDRSGTVSITTVASATPLRVVVTAGALSASSDVAAGTTATTQLTIPGNGAISPITVYVQIQPLGAIGPDANYTVSASYPTGQTGRSRPVRR